MNLPRPNKVNPLWSDASRLPPIRSVYEPVTYVPETGIFRENIPSPWDTKLSEHFNYGTIADTVNYNRLESQPGQNAWLDDFTGVNAQLVINQPNLNAYDFEAPQYNRYTPRTATVVQGQPAQIAVKQTAMPLSPNVSRHAVILDDDIDLGELEYFNNSVPKNTEFVAGIPRQEIETSPELIQHDAYDFEAPKYAYTAADDLTENSFIPTSNQSTTPPVDINSLSTWERFKLGWKEGNSYGVGENPTDSNFDPKGKAYYSKSILFDRAPKTRYANLDNIGNAGFVGGRIVADLYGNGTRKYLWNIQPEDLVNTEGKAIMNHAGSSRTAQLAIPYAATLALGVGSGNYNPLNVMQGGRPDGFSAINPSNDPRESTSPVYDIAIERGMLGRRGRLLPWEQFHEERPDISFDKYDKYQRYLTNKDPNMLRTMTGGLAKGTLDGINGPEVSVMGYSVNPLGAAAAAGIILAGRKAILK